jgi:ribokinase
MSGKAMSRSIVVVGSLNADLVVRMQRFPDAGETVIGESFASYPGGKGANQAYGVAKLGGRVAMVGQVGNDTQGAWLKQHLADAGVDVSHVRADSAAATGVAVIAIDGSAQNRIVITPGANGSLSAERLDASAALIAKADFLLLQLEIPLPAVERAARLAKEAGAVVILDPAPAAPLGPGLLQWVDYITPNETELLALTRGSRPGVLARVEAVRRAGQLRALGAKGVIVKLGAAGAVLVSERGEHLWPAFPVTAVDTTAAGDAFNAAFAFALADGQTEQDAGRFATAAAAISVTRAGAQPSMPSRTEVEALLKDQPRL